jgi:hypothetical protein
MFDAKMKIAKSECLIDVIPTLAMDKQPRGELHSSNQRQKTIKLANKAK